MRHPTEISRALNSVEDMISTLLIKLKTAVRSSRDDESPSSADRREVAFVNGARTEDDRWRVARRDR